MIGGCDLKVEQNRPLAGSGKLQQLDWTETPASFFAVGTVPLPAEHQRIGCYAALQAG
jgi:hypothetical protein